MANMSEALRPYYNFFVLLGVNFNPASNLRYIYFCLLVPYMFVWNGFAFVCYGRIHQLFINFEEYQLATLVDRAGHGLADCPRRRLEPGLLQGGHGGYVSGAPRIRGWAVQRGLAREDKYHQCFVIDPCNLRRPLCGLDRLLTHT